MGANIKGVGTDTLIIEGGNELRPADIEIIPDRIEAGTFFIAGALLGEIKVEDVKPEHLENVINKLRQTDCEINATKDTVSIIPPEILSLLI